MAGRTGKEGRGERERRRGRGKGKRGRRRGRGREKGRARRRRRGGGGGRGKGRAHRLSGHSDLRALHMVWPLANMNTVADSQNRPNTDVQTSFCC